MNGQKEFLLKGEDRFHDVDVLSFAKYRCACRSRPSLEQRFNFGMVTNEYRVICALASGKLVGEPFRLTDQHTEPTPWLSSASDAIQHWKLVAALTRQ